ncbi:ABC transporter substrate-binding protein [Candidatus Reidiella endopervernicosa]|uniref:Thiamine pyrimidine synthase n=2 Tax=Candidatus Reidiella endopervernicosa TaxID=2738883 RepID=A0A6N0HX33_9GAMM|nr:ABC transporter substrate-binding protein [Candidatus Reidiella endopervernicosa]
MTAYLTDQPYYYRERGVSVRMINPLNYGIDLYGDMLFTSEDIMQTQPELALRFRRAALKGWQYALENPEEVVDWTIERYGSKRVVPHFCMRPARPER